MDMPRWERHMSKWSGALLQVVLKGTVWLQLAIRLIIIIELVFMPRLNIIIKSVDIKQYQIIASESD